MDRAAKLSEHFRLSEFLVSDTAPDLAAAMRPDEYQLVSLTRVANLILEPARLKICEMLHKNTPLVITSGIRTEGLIAALINAGYPASRTSQHCYGEAADFIVPKITRVIFCWIYHNCPVRQTILYEDEHGAPIGNLHVSVAPLDGRDIEERFVIDRRVIDADTKEVTHEYHRANVNTGRIVA